MKQRINAFTDFAGHFFRYAMFVREVLMGLLILLALGGAAISHFEDIPLRDALYFTGITGLSIGYGDITPKTGMGKLMSVVIGLVGMIFTGMNVAVASRALSDTVRGRPRTHE